jgi:hypothetical protein
VSAVLEHFDGADVVHSRDVPRLTGQLLRVYYAILDGEWHTVDAVSRATGDQATSVSAQLRNLRKARFGGHTIDRKHIGNGLYQYRLAVKERHD